MATRPDPDRLALWRSFLEAHAAITTKLAAELQAERQLPLAWFDVLTRLGEAGGRLRMRELAVAVSANKSSLSRQVDRMEAEGLVRREDVADDGRGQFAVLTKAGRELLRRSTPLHQRGVQREFAQHLTDTDVAAMQRALAKLVSAHKD
jgi:DNA-binding MarR family transcriptional regulator